MIKLDRFKVNPIQKSITNSKMIESIQESKAPNEEEIKSSSGKEKISKKFQYKQESDVYEGSLILEGDKLKLDMMEIMESVYWESEFNMKELSALSNKWLSLLDEKIIFKFIINCFNNSNVVLTQVDDAKLKLEFKHQIVGENILLPLFIKGRQVNLDQVIAKQGSIIKNLVRERENLKTLVNQLNEEVKGLKKGNRDVFVLIREINTAGNPTTFSSGFIDLAATTTGELTIRSKSKVKWNLFIGGLYLSAGGGDRTGKFRIELTDKKTNAKQYWPNAEGCTSYMFNGASAHIGATFSYGDVAEVDEGEYTAKLQWGYTSNSPQYCLSFYPTHGEARVIVDVC